MPRKLYGSLEGLCGQITFRRFFRATRFRVPLIRHRSRGTLPSFNPGQRRAREDGGGDGVEEARDGGERVRGRAAVDARRVDEVEVAFGARRGGVEQAPLFLQIFELFGGARR